jgi:hypothetical protein
LEGHYSEKTFSEFGPDLFVGTREVISNAIEVKMHFWFMNSVAVTRDFIMNIIIAKKKNVIGSFRISRSPNEKQEH